MARIPPPRMAQFRKSLARERRAFDKKAAAVKRPATRQKWLAQALQFERATTDNLTAAMDRDHEGVRPLFLKLKAERDEADQVNELLQQSLKIQGGTVRLLRENNRLLQDHAALFDRTAGYIVACLLMALARR